MRISAVGNSHQLRVIALLHDAASVHDEDSVGVSDGRQTVRDTYRADVPERVNSLLHESLALVVQRAGRFVKQQHLRLAQKGACDGDALLLSAADLAAAAATKRVELKGKAVDELQHLSAGARVFNLGLRGSVSVLIGKSIQKVFANAHTKHDRLLPDIAEHTAQVHHGHGLDVYAVQENGTELRVVETHEKRDNGALAAAAAADKSNFLTNGEIDADTVEHGDGGSGRVAEGDVVEGKRLHVPDGSRCLWRESNRGIGSGQQGGVQV